MAMTGGANAVGMLSALIFRAVGEGRGGAREAEGSAFVLLETEESMRNSGREPLCRVRSARSTPGLPNFDPLTGESWMTALPEKGKEAHHPILFGGSVFEEDTAAMARETSRISRQAHTWFGLSGSFGAASVAFDVSTGAEMIVQGLSTNISCFNRDIFGRESLIWLEKAG
jgi:hypothetical protein